MHNRANQRQRGFTLLEVLIAFFILSVGLLGVVSLIGTSKLFQHQAVQRTRAVAIADTLIERIRINPAAVASYNIGFTPLGLVENRTEPSPNCSSDPCSSAELALHDLWAWEKLLLGEATQDQGQSAGGLIAATGCVVFIADAPRTRTGQVSIVIQWRGLKETIDALSAGDPVCGSNAAGSDNFRRQVTVNTYVVDETEF
ncbi:MAG: type IV pilus assembly protein PilV [Halioglobus sp.]|jgi:type IV pilus assembly protein PilV